MREGYGSRRVCLCVCVCVCVSVKSHLTSGASIRSGNAVTNSVGDEGRKICGVFSDTAPLPRSSAPSLGWPYIQSAIFPADNTHAHCVYASSPKFAMDAPCCKLSLRSSFMISNYSCVSCYLLVCTLYLPSELWSCYIADSAKRKSRGKHVNETLRWLATV